MSDRQHLRADGPLSQKLVLASFKLAGPFFIAGTAAWLAGLRVVGNVLVGGASGVAGLMIVAALFVERRERRRERAEADAR